VVQHGQWSTELNEAKRAFVTSPAGYTSLSQTMDELLERGYKIAPLPAAVIKHSMEDHLPGLQRSLTQKDSGKEWTDETHERTHSLRKGLIRHMTRRLVTNWQNFIFLRKFYTKGEET
jgi:hypothetical protein